MSNGPVFFQLSPHEWSQVVMQMRLFDRTDRSADDFGDNSFAFGCSRHANKLDEVLAWLAENQIPYRREKVGNSFHFIEFKDEKYATMFKMRWM